MILSNFLSLAALAAGGISLGVAGQQAEIVPRACSRTVTANKGDTCASLASTGGITVSQFLQANPSVSSCSQLAAGSTYCLDGTLASPSTTVAAPTTTPSKVSGDGTCGLNTAGLLITCAGSKWGDCCSQHNFCGGTADYCGAGCLAAFGNCGADAGGGSSAPAPPTSTATTITPTSTPTTPTTPIFTPVPPPTATTGTVWVTSTGTIFKTVTSTDVVRTTSTVVANGGTTTGVVYVRSTITVTSTALANVTNTVAVTATSVSVRFTTSLVIRTSTSVQTDTLTTITTVTLTKTVTTTAAGCNIGTLTYQEPPVLTTIIPTSRPYPSPTLSPRPPSNLILPGTPSNCNKYDQIVSTDNCLTVARRNSITLRDFQRINPSIDCDNLWVGYYVCVG